MPDTPFQFYKRHQLLSRVLLFTAAAAGLHALWDMHTGSAIIVLADLGIMCWMLILYYLNQKKYSAISRYGYLISATLIVVIYSSVVPRENGVNLLFLPLLSLVFVVFDYQQHGQKLFTSIFMLLGYILLEITDYRVLGEVQLLEEPDNGSFIVNFISSGVLLYLSFNFITRANHAAEQHLQLMAEEVQQQNQQLSKTNEELDRFVYSTSHDLRAPLLSVLGLVQLMENKKGDEDQQPYLDMMRNRINNLQSFIGDITDYARNARLPLQAELVPLDALVAEIISNHQFLHPDRKLEIRQEVYVDHALPLDRQRLLTVLNNLLSNAIKYHRMQHAQSYVSIGARQQQDQLHLWVADNGPGIAAQVQDRMFEMFYRGDERSGGSGLGLYIVKEAVAKLGGRLEVTSVLGEGTTFHVWVPLLPLAAATASQGQEDPAHTIAVTG